MMSSTPHSELPTAANGSHDIRSVAGRLLYRRQFVLGPRSVNRLDGREGWTELALADRLILTVHPDLELHHLSRGEFTLVLLGYLLDPLRPELTNAECFHNLARSGECPTFAEVVQRTASLGGRWALLYRHQRELKLFTDPFGSRQIFYHAKGVEKWCASQPHVIAQQLHIPRSVDPDLLGFVSSPLFAETENCWVGDGTLYDGITHLLPNHYLDLTEGKVVRYWPSRKFEHFPLGQAALSISDLLKGLLESASRRQPLLLAVTAGWDSRVLLAASRNLRGQIHYFTQRFGAMTEAHADLAVPARLLKKLGLKHHIHDCPDEVDPAFKEILYKNVSTIQSEHKIPLYYDYYKHHGGSLNVNGNGSEIGRNHLRYASNPRSGRDLADSFGRKDDPYAMRCLQRWLEETQPVVDQCEMDINDLFYWEQRWMGNWKASWSADLDIAIEEFMPFNCRAIMELFLSTDKECRLVKQPAVHRAVIEYTWPEALSEPFNPHFAEPAKSNLRRRLHNWRLKLSGRR